jgi:hypothetical protein
MTINPVEKKIRGIASLKLTNIGVAQTSTQTVYEVLNTMYPNFWVITNEDNETPSSNIAFDYSVLDLEKTPIQSLSDFKAEIDIDFPLCVVDGCVMQLTNSSLLTTNLESKPSPSLAYSGKVIKALMTSIKNKPKDLIEFRILDNDSLLVSSTKGSIMLNPDCSKQADLAIKLCKNYLNLDRATFNTLRLQSSVLEKLPQFNRVQQNLV